MTPVPVTMQVFAVLLSGLLLGRKWGAFAQIQYLLLGLSGMPVFALSKAGPVVLFGMTGGYLLSYPLAAWIVGLLADNALLSVHPPAADTKQASVWSLWYRLMLACSAGLFIIYGLGCTWLALASHTMLSLPAVLLAGVGWFLLWDVLKSLLAIYIALLVRRPQF